MNMPPMTTLRPCLDTKRPATVDETEFNNAEGIPTQPAMSAEYPSPFWKYKATSTQILVAPINHSVAMIVPLRKLEARKIFKSTIG